MKNVVFWDIKTQFVLHMRHITSSGMLHRVALVTIDVSKEPSASIIRVTRIGELGTLTVTSTDARYEEILRRRG
jgi:hypothetical protein